MTGAAGGLGSAIMLAFREHGAEVEGVDVAPVDGLVACDVTDKAAVRNAFASGPFDDVVHAAGTVAVRDIRDMGLETFRRVIDVNLIGAFLVGREAARQVTSGSTITFIASQGGRKGGAGWGAYCASKFGMIGFAESLAQELAREGARVNSVCPGTVDTPMTQGAIRRPRSSEARPPRRSARATSTDSARSFRDARRGCQCLRVSRLAARALRRRRFARRGRRRAVLMPVTRLGHVSVTVADMDRALAFWHNALDLELIGRGIVRKTHLDRITGLAGTEIEWAELSVPGGSVIELFRYLNPRRSERPTPAPNDPGATHVCLEVTGIDKILCALRAAGYATRSDAPVEIPGRRLARLAGCLRREPGWHHCRDAKPAHVRFEHAERPRATGASQCVRPDAAAWARSTQTYAVLPKNGASAAVFD